MDSHSPRLQSRQPAIAEEIQDGLHDEMIRTWLREKGIDPTLLNRDSMLNLMSVLQKQEELEESIEKERSGRLAAEKLVETERAEKLKEREEKLKEREAKLAAERLAEKERKGRVAAESRVSYLEIKSKELQRKLDLATAQLETKFQNAEARNPATWVRLGDVLAKEQPPILAELAQHTQQDYRGKAIVTRSGSNPSKAFVSSGAGLTRVHPPQFATLLRRRDPTANEISKRVPVDPKLVFKYLRTTKFKSKDYSLYQHKSTGLLVSVLGIGERFWPKPGVYESCLVEWEIDRFKNHLMTAESARLKVDSEIVPIYSRVMDVFLNDMLYEFALGTYDGLGIINTESEMQLSMGKTVFFFIERVFQKALGKRADLKFIVNTGKQGTNQPSLSSIRILDITYAIIYKGELLLRIVQENKAAYKFPCLWTDIDGEDDAEAILSNLIDFYNSNTGRKSYADKNTLMQLRVYLGIHHRRFGIVCSLNCWSFVELEEDGTMHVSKRFMANEKDPSLQMGMLEVLIRFICAAIGEDVNFGTIKERPKFISEWAIAVLGKDLDKDFTALRPDPGDDHLSDDDEGDEATGDGGEGKEKQDSNTGADGSSSSGGGTASGDQSRDSSSKTGGKGRKAALEPPGPRCWVDLEDPRRNAPDSGLTFEQHMSPLGSLEGDAVPIGSGRTGWVVRKRFDEIDMAVKLLCPSRYPDEDEPSVETLSAELDNEERIYRKLEALQGEIVPRCFGCRWFGILDIEAFVTEYVGPSVAKSDGKVLAHQAESAVQALKRIHKAGVLHGDVDNLGNVLWDESRQCAMFIDFAFGRFRDDFASENEWLDAVRKEEEELRVALGLDCTEKKQSSDEDAAALSSPVAPVSKMPSYKDSERRTKKKDPGGPVRGKRKKSSNSSPSSSGRRRSGSKKRKH